MRVLVAVGIVLLSSVMVLVGYVYAINPLDFGNNIVAPLFDLLIGGWIGLGLLAFALSRFSLTSLQAKSIAIVLLLVPAGFVLWGTTQGRTEGCFGPCGQNMVFVSSTCAGASAITCLVNVYASVFIPSVTSGTIVIDNATTTGECGVYQVYTNQSESVRCEFPDQSEPVGTPFSVSISLPGGGTAGTEGNLTTYVQANPEGISLETASCEVSASITCGLSITNSGNESSSIYQAQEISYTAEVPGMCEPAGCESFTQYSADGTCTPTSIDARNTELVSCAFVLSTPPSGGGYEGTLLFRNGAELSFGGNFTS